MIAFAIMYVGTFILCMSQAMMINALSTILAEFNISAGFGQLLTTGYIFALGLISASTATLVDRFSTKTLCLVSLACFIAGSILCVTATSFPLLLIGRLVQAGGAGISLPLIQDVALIIYPKEQYGRAMGAVGLIIGFAPAIGPALAGPIIDYLGWRALFVILGACASLVFLLAVFFVRDLAEHRDTKFNATSTALFSIGFVALMGALSVAESNGFTDPLGWVLFAGGAAALVGYVMWEQNSPNPMLHLRAFRSKRFTVDCVLVVFSQASMMIASIMVPLYVQGVQGASATVSGLTIMPGAILLGILNPVTGRLFDRIGPRALTLSGCALILIGTLAFVLCTPDTSPWTITAIYGVRIVGIACIWTPLVADASLALPEKEKNQATAITTSMRQLFSAMLSTVFVTIMSANSIEATGISDYGFDVSFLVLSALTAAMFVFAAVTVKWKQGAKAE